MQFLHNYLGNLDGNEMVVVELSAAANVKLMDRDNFSAYRRDSPHKYFGGYVTETPFRVRVPSRGHWHLTVDRGGYSGGVRAAVRVIG